MTLASNLSPRFKPILLLTLWVGLLLVLRGPQQSLMAHDEGWYAQQARWIVDNGDWLTQQWWGELIYDRSMGLQWLIALFYRLFGVSDTVARLPGILATLGSVWLTYAIGRRCLPEKTAFLGAAILAVTPIWMQSARLATQNVPLTCIELLAIWALLKVEMTKTGRWQWGLLAGSTLGIGFLIKSFMVFPAAAALLPYFVFEHRRHRHLLNPGLYAGFLLGAIPTVLWLGLSVQRYGRLPIDNFFGLLIFLSQTAYHPAGPLYYFWNIPINAFPWPLLAIPGIALALKNPGYQRRWLWLGYPICLFVELTLFKTKTWYYPLQLMPFIALMAAVTLMTMAQAYRRRRQSGVTVALTYTLASLGLVLSGAGVLLLLNPGLFGLEPGWAYGLLGLLAGLSWLIPLVVDVYDRRWQTRSPKLWLFGWLLGPWFAIATLYGTGLWGNYGSQIKVPLQSSPIVEVLQTHLIHFVFPEWNYNGSAEDTVLLTFYTPQLGDRFAQTIEVPNGNYAWVHRDMLPTITRTYQTVGEAGSWALVEFAI